MIFRRYTKAVKIWHNEGCVKHMLDSVDKVEADVWHFGASDPPARCKSETHFCLMENIHPPSFTRKTVRQVEEGCRRLISEVAYGGGFWLSTGGGMTSDTPLRSVEAMIRTAYEYGRYPERLEPG